MLSEKLKARSFFLIVLTASWAGAALFISIGPKEEHVIWHPVSLVVTGVFLFLMTSILIELKRINRQLLTSSSNEKR